MALSQGEIQCDCDSYACMESSAGGRFRMDNKTREVMWMSEPLDMCKEFQKKVDMILEEVNLQLKTNREKHGTP